MPRARLDVTFRQDLTVDEVGALWLALEETARPSFFLSWRWVGCWLRQTGLAPGLLVAHRDGKSVGLALLQSGAGAVFPHLPGRHLTSSGDSNFDSVFVEYNGFLAAPSDQAEVGLSFRDYLSPKSSGGDPPPRWSRIHLPGVSEEMLRLWSSGRFIVKTEASRPAPFVDLAELRRNRSNFLESRSANCRQQINRSKRLFQEQGPLQLEAATTLDQARAMFDELVLLHQRSWQARGKPGAFAIPFFKQFHRALLEGAWPTGQIELLRLRAGSSTVGCLYNFLYGGEIYAYQSGFQYDGDARHKPGLVTHAMAAERYLAAGHDRYLLLAGESRYKTSLATGADTLHWLVVRRIGFRAAAEEWVEMAGHKAVAASR
jgi:CelD/BcsL family acetyltransferase involved in cellulose biosynthesis